MPKTDGIEVFQRMRQRGSSKPMLLLTVKAETDDHVVGLDRRPTTIRPSPLI